MVKRERVTTETRVKVEVNTATTAIATGIPFFDHMLEQVVVHSGLRLTIEARGDAHIDAHHTVEDVGIVLGEALDELCGDRRGVERFGHAIVPMDEALVGISLDLSGRAYAACSLALANTVPGFSEETVREFFWGLARGGRLTVHVWKLSGAGDHHIIEAAFKGLGLILRQVRRGALADSVPSSKGVL